MNKLKALALSRQKHKTAYYGVLKSFISFMENAVFLLKLVIQFVVSGILH
jgi:hypothetical protein